MNDIDDEEAIEQLRKAGLTTPEIERLRQLRRNDVAHEERQVVASPRRSRLVRWLLALLQEGYGPSAPWWW